MREFNEFRILRASAFFDKVFVPREQMYLSYRDLQKVILPSFLIFTPLTAFRSSFIIINMNERSFTS